VIVDASAFLVTLSSGRIESDVRDADLAAPDLLIVEVLNAFWKLRRARLEVPSTDDVLALLERVAILPTRPYAERAAEIAEKIDHPVYDCLYLAVAEARNDVLITADGRFYNKLAKSALRKRVRLIAI
jgi:predicted nucleic acid-binding protein